MKRTLGLATLVAGAWAAVAVAAGGGPTPGIAFGQPGVLDPSGDVRYQALTAGRGTTVAAIRVRDGSTGGLARNGRRLVLSSFPSHGLAVSRFVVLHPRTLRVRSRVTLRGAFAFDALSPGGSLMYLLQYLGGPQSTRYAVRVLNVNTKQLYPGSIVDRREPDEKMTGVAVTRAESHTGAWAYTLYSRAGQRPFVHALDTVHRRAFCVDLPLRTRANVISLVKMHVSRGELLLRLRGKTVARVDTETFEVRR
jgi:hypothetical protein